MTSEIDLVKILQGIHSKLDSGFVGVYARIDNIETETREHRKFCESRIGALERDALVRKALNGFKNESDKNKRDIWKWIIRGTISTIAGGALLLVWQMITGQVRLIMG